MATQDPTRGSGDDKITQAVSPGYDAPPDVQAVEPSGSSQGDPTRGGCLKFGWGCLPLLGAIVMIPAGLVSHFAGWAGSLP